MRYDTLNLIKLIDLRKHIQVFRFAAARFKIISAVLIDFQEEYKDLSK